MCLPHPPAPSHEAMGSPCPQFTAPEKRASAAGRLAGVGTTRTTQSPQPPRLQARTCRTTTRFLPGSQTAAETAGGQRSSSTLRVPRRSPPSSACAVGCVCACVCASVRGWVLTGTSPSPLPVRRASRPAGRPCGWRCGALAGDVGGSMRADDVGGSAPAPPTEPSEHRCGPGAPPWQTI